MKQLAPRFHHQLIPNAVIAEKKVDPVILEGLVARGHEVHVMAPGLYYSSVQAIRKDPVTGKILLQLIQEKTVERLVLKKKIFHFVLAFCTYTL